jgi:uncharacterized protein (TIGR03437 family)
MNSYLSRYFLLVTALLYSASAQTTRNIDINVTGTSTITGVIAASGAGNGTVNPFGNAAVSLATTQSVDANFRPVGSVQDTVTFSFNRLDSFSVTATSPDLSNANVATFPGTISGGTGAYNGASGSGTFTVTIVNRGSGGTSAQLTLSGTANMKVGQTTTAISLANINLTAGASPIATISATGSGSITPLGNVTLSAKITSTDLVAGQGTATFTFNASDSLTVYFSIPDLSPKSYSFPSTVMGGTGVYAGATGSATMTTTNTSNSTFALAGSGTVTQPAPGTVRPTITSVKTSGSDAAFIAPNTWVEVQGINLVPANTSGLVTWSTAPEFNANPPHMPIQLGPISATTNGKPAYIYLYCHACGDNQTDQINILTSLDATVGQMLVVVTNGTGSSAPFIVTMQAASPSFLRWDLQGHPVATHTDAKLSLLGPTSLFPGLTTPARKQEPILIYGDGFGLPTASLVEGSASQSGVLPNPQPACAFGTTPVAATVVLVSPGLYGIGMTVPDTAVSGDNLVTCWYGNAATPAGDVISVQ